MPQPQKHGGYSDYQTILSDDCRGCAAGRLLDPNAISLWKVLISNKSVSRRTAINLVCGIDGGGPFHGRPLRAGHVVLQKNNLLWGNQPVCVLAEWRAPASAPSQ
jgi:hypothetical protein